VRSAFSVERQRNAVLRADHVNPPKRTIRAGTPSRSSDCASLDGQVAVPLGWCCFVLGIEPTALARL
jgi:hypothetical protein